MVRHNLDADSFPFTLQAHDERSGELLWEHVCQGPGPIEVPGWAPRKVSITVIDSAGNRSIRFSSGVESPAP